MTDIKITNIDPSKLLWLLDPGHGCDTPGKRSPEIPPGIYEWEFNRDVVNRIISLGEAAGIQCVDIVVQKESIPLRERVRRANKLNETHRCAFISVHANASGKGGWSNAEGFAVFIKPGASIPEQNLALILSEELPQIVLRNRGIKVAGFYVLKRTKMPAVLTENGFMTSKSDCELLSRPAGRQAIAASHVAAMLRYEMDTVTP
jgi:N-acetylmuramoyl-L-alanine amidase